MNSILNGFVGASPLDIIYYGTTVSAIVSAFVFLVLIVLGIVH